MTEYDYSPEAYERHLANQNRVSNWVSDQASRKHQYSNPFTPPPLSIPPSQPGPRSASYQSPSSSRQSSPARDYRQDPRRPAVPLEPYRPPHAGHAPVPPPRREQPRSVSMSYTPTSLPPGATYRTYDASSREVVIPAPRKGETYVIIPPKNGRVEIVTDNGSSVQSTYSSTYRTSSAKSPPLLKRLFTQMGPPVRDSRQYYGSSSNVRSNSRRSY